MHIYLYRHQAGGIVTDFAFTEAPNNAQLAPLRARMLQRHGPVHKKTNEPFWDRVVEVPMFAAGAIPAYPPEKGGTGVADVARAEFTVAGKGNVSKGTAKP
jgi:hypothetical protein